MTFPARIRLLALFALSLQSVVQAAPLAGPGDIALRHDIQVLADYGVIKGPVTTWPLSWDAIRSDLEAAKANDVELPGNVARTMDRVLARSLAASRRGEHRISGSLAIAEEPIRIRAFADTPREQGEIRATYSWLGENFQVSLSASAVDSPSDGEDFRADGSLIALDFANWTIAASTMDRWWGPGWDGSLILSNNARPVPALTLSRNHTRAFKTKWLSWMGPWDAHLIWGQLESARAVPNARFFGLRVNFKPLQSLEIGLSRTAQWCGDGRPCDFGTLTDLLRGRDNIGDAGTTAANEPGNQMAGFDVRWTSDWFGTPVSLYGQMIGEDEAGGFPSRYLAQFGIDGSGFINDRWSFRWYAEVAGTSCDFVKDDLFNCAYRHGIYQSGYTYRGRIIGHGLDNDALVYSAGVVVLGEEGNAWHVLARVGDLNREGADPQHSTAVVPTGIASIDVQHSRSTRFGQLKLGLGVERLDSPLLGANTSEVRGFLQWHSR